MNKPSTKSKILKTLLIVFLLLLIFLAVFLPLKFTGSLDKIDSAEDLKNVILNFGAYGYIVFFIIQILQTTILPIPGVITTIAGMLIYGPLEAYLITLVAVLLGSSISFFLGRKLGKKLVVWIVGIEDAEKWINVLSKGKFAYFLMMLFPLFPDDILCIVAGITNMTYKYFITTNLVTRPIVYAIVCFLGSGNIIPYSGWGIPVWIVLGVGMAVLLYLSFKYQAKIENFVLRLTKKVEDKKSLAKVENTTTESNEELKNKKPNQNTNNDSSNNEINNT